MKRKIQETAKHHWYRIPRRVRRPLVIVAGFLCILAAGAIGWLPGPGGIPLFLIGIMILATEFSWAERFRDIILELVKRSGRFVKKHRFLSAFLFVCGVTLTVCGIYFIFAKP